MFLLIEQVRGPSGGLSWASVYSSRGRDVEAIGSASSDSCLVAPPLLLLDT